MNHENKTDNMTAIGLIGAGLLTLLGIAVAVSQTAPDVTTVNNTTSTVAAPPPPTISRDFAGSNIFAAMNQLQQDGFSLADKTIVIAPWSAAPNCAAPTDAELETSVTVKSVTAKDGVATVVVQDNRVCPAPVNVNLPNVGVPNPNLPNHLPRISSGGGSGGGGGESRFCRKRWWC